MSWPEVAVSRDDLLDRSEPLEYYNTTDDHLTSVIALLFTRWQHQHTQYIPQVAAPLPNRPNHHTLNLLNLNAIDFCSGLLSVFKLFIEQSEVIVMLMSVYMCVSSLISRHNVVKCGPIVTKLYTSDSQRTSRNDYGI